MTEIGKPGREVEVEVLIGDATEVEAEIGTEKGTGAEKKTEIAIEIGIGKETEKEKEIEIATEIVTEIGEENGIEMKLLYNRNSSRTKLH